MTARHLTIRDLPKALATALDRESRRRGVSLDQTVKDLLARALGLELNAFDNGLGDLAGSWDEDELRQLARDTAMFGQVDE